MGFDLKKLGNKTGKAKIEVFGEEINVEYKPNVITAQWSDDLDSLVRAGANSDQLFEKMFELITGWDVTNDGEPVALPTPEQRKALKDARDKLENADEDKKIEKAEEDLKKAKDAALGDLREYFPLPFVGQLLQACARDMSVGGANPKR